MDIFSFAQKDMAITYRHSHAMYWGSFDIRSGLRFSAIHLYNVLGAILCTS